MPIRQLAVIGLLFVFGALRLTGFFSHPYFYAEDGAIFFKDSINLGLASLFADVVGHHNFVQRLTALLALLFPVVWIPVVYKAAALLVTSWCFSIFSRPGFRWVVPEDSDRMVLCVLFSLLPGASELAITICTFYYPFLLASLLLIIERDAGGRHRLTFQNLLLLTVLFFSTGHAVVCLPLILYFVIFHRSRNHAFAAGILVLTVLINIVAVFSVDGRYQYVGRSLVGTVASSLQIWIENFFARVVYLPLFGSRIAQGILMLPDLAFWAISVFLLVAVTGLAHLRGVLPKAVRSQKFQILSLLLTCVLCLMPLSVLVRSYLIPIYSRPSLSFEYRYSFLPAFAVLLAFSSLISSIPRARSGGTQYVQFFLFVYLSWNLIAFPIFPDIPQSPEFEAAWPAQASRIQAALKNRELGQLREPVPIGSLRSLPVGWNDFDTNLVIQPVANTLAAPGTPLAASFAAQDFVVRHAAFQLFRNGENAYDFSRLRAVEKNAVGWDVNTPFLNPPWTLLVLAPVLIWPYFDAALLWAIANAFFYFSIIMLCFRSIRASRPPSGFELLLSAAFLPGIICVIWGQLGFLLAFGAALLIFAESRKKVSLATTGTLLLTVKPHLVFLPILAALYESARRKRFRVLVSVILILAGALIALEAYSPGITSSWFLASQLASRDLSVMRSANIPAIAGLLAGGGTSIVLPVLFGFSVLSIIGLAVFLRVSRRKLTVQRDLPWLLPLSLMFTPYAWHHDFALLFPVHVLLVARISHLRTVKLQRSFILSIVLLNAAVALQMVFAFRFAAEFAWIPIFYLVLGLWLESEEKRVAESPSRVRS